LIIYNCKGRMKQKILIFNILFFLLLSDCSFINEEKGPKVTSCEELQKTGGSACEDNIEATCDNDKIIYTKCEYGCSENKCAESCIPDCTDKECGDNGCGGNCGYCEENYKCEKNKCVYNSSCGNYNCEEGEDYQNCPSDCACQPNCNNKECGDNDCGGTCGECNYYESCSNGKCVTSCSPNCNGKECGDDGCGGSCGICSDEEFCVSETQDLTNDEHFIWKCMKKCYNEGYRKCFEDIYYGICKNPEYKFYDCPGEETCTYGGFGDGTSHGEDVCQGSCTPNCTNKECGDDGCGGSCGECSGESGKSYCKNGKCDCCKVCFGSTLSCGGVSVIETCSWNNCIEDVTCEAYCKK
jgi:hypothetical protein